MRILHKEFNSSNTKFIYYKKKYITSEIYKKILNLYYKIKSKKKGVVSICTKDKIDFIIKFYALNKAGFSILINDKNNKNYILNEKVNVNYYFKNNKLLFINSKKIKNQKKKSKY